MPSHVDTDRASLAADLQATTSTTSTDGSPSPPRRLETDETPFLCRRNVRLAIYAFLAFIFLLMVGWRVLPMLTDPTFEKHIQEKRVAVGMTREQVMQAWGSPYQTNVSYTKDGIRREEWIYEDWEDAGHLKHRYLYFQENTLVGGWSQ